MAIHFCVYVSRIEHIEDPELLFSSVAPEVFAEAEKFFSWEAASHVERLKTINKIRKGNILPAIERLYFGQETCERLIPSAEDIGKVALLCAERKWGLSLVLPYVGPFGAEKIRGLIPAISEASSLLGGVEVVVQDYAGLLIISDLKNPNIVPVLGRLFTKMKRDPRFRVEEVVVDQYMRDLDLLKRTSFEHPRYRSLLNSLGVRRVSIEPLPQGLDLTRVEGLMIDMYWPWIYVTSGRACKTAALTDPEKARYPKESPCNMECRRMQIDYPVKSLTYTELKGNAVWMESLNLDILPDVVDRLIYEPYMPV